MFSGKGLAAIAHRKKSNHRKGSVFGFSNSLECWMQACRLFGHLAPSSFAWPFVPFLYPIPSMMIDGVVGGTRGGHGLERREVKKHDRVFSRYNLSLLFHLNLFFSSSVHPDSHFHHPHSHLSTTQQPPHKPNYNDCHAHCPGPIALLPGQAGRRPIPGSGRVWHSKWAITDPWNALAQQRRAAAGMDSILHQRVPCALEGCHFLKGERA